MSRILGWGVKRSVQSRKSPRLIIRKCRPTIIANRKRKAQTIQLFVPKVVTKSYKLRIRINRHSHGHFQCGFLGDYFALYNKTNLELPTNVLFMSSLMAGVVKKLENFASICLFWTLLGVFELLEFLVLEIRLGIHKTS